MSDAPTNPTPNNPPAVQSAGGPGVLLGDPNRFDSDVNLLRRAARERWPIPPAKRAAIVEQMISIAESATETARARTSAARVLASMDGLNQADDHLADKNARLDEGKATERIEGVELRVLGMQAKD